MNPWLAEEYGTENNIRILLNVRRRPGNEKIAGLVDAFLSRHGIGPGQGGPLQQLLFSTLSRAASWPLRDSTEMIPPWLNQFRVAEKGPQVFNDALTNLRSFLTGGGTPQLMIPGIGPFGPASPASG